MCLHNDPQHRPDISKVCKDIKCLKTNANKQDPVTTGYGFQTLSDKVKFFNEISLVQQKSNELQEQV